MRKKDWIGVIMKFVSAVMKELLEISHDRTMLLVLLAFPVIIMLFMGSSFRSMEINGLPIGVVGPQNSSFSVMLLNGLNESKAFKISSFESETDAFNQFKNGQLKAIIIVPQDFEGTLSKGNGSKIRILVDNSDLALEQAVLAAMTSVVQASSADITKTYVSGAWKELGALNDSAGALAGEISASRAKIAQTKANLIQIRAGMNDSDVADLEASLDDASSSMALLRDSLAEQKASLINASAGNTALLDQTDYFLMNATQALNSSITTVKDAHDKLVNQTNGLNQTANQLGFAISGLETIKSTVSDNITAAALELDIMGLQSLRNSTLSQIDDARNETLELEGLQTTLNGFGLSLQNYSGQVDSARGSGNNSAMLAALDNADMQISALNGSFSSAKLSIGKLKATMGQVKGMMADIETTLDDALNQTASVDNLIASLQKTVTEQTAKDPNMIASPLAIELQDQYVRVSYVDFLMPQVISISLLFSCFLLSSISLVREKTRNTIIRALMMPFGLINMVLGKILSLVLLSIGQVALVLLVALLIFGVKPPLDIGMLLFGTVVSALVLSSIGVLIGFYAKTESAAIQTCLLIAIPMLFLGNIIFSPDLLPAYTQILQQLLPLAHITNIFKVVLITGGNPLIDIIALLTYFVLLVIVLAFILMKRKDISNYQ